MSRYNDVAKQVGQRSQQAGNLPLDHPRQAPRGGASPTVIEFWRRMHNPPPQAMEYGIFPPTHTPRRRDRQPGEDDE